MVLRQFPLSNMCFRDQHLWRVRFPMICFFAVEWHLPHRVSKQFGVQQRTPPEYVETSVVLHRSATPWPLALPKCSKTPTGLAFLSEQEVKNKLQSNFVVHIVHHIK